MLLDNVFSMARRAAPGGTGFRRSARRSFRRAAAPSRPSQSAISSGTQREISQDPRSSISQGVVCLLPSRPVEEDVAPVLVDSALSRVAACEPLPVVVVLTLEATSDIGDDACEALVELHYKLRANGVRLFVGALSAGVLGRMRENGVVSRIGPEAVWPSLQTAMLAAYGELTGPAVVTRNVLAALHQRLVPLPL
jgi:hypothetical protein